MKFYLALGAIIVSQALAACPNACSGHGKCGSSSKCTCYSGWISNDCSERSCMSSYAFVDIPQGDQNGDGKVNMDLIAKGDTNPTENPNGEFQTELYSGYYGYAREISETPDKKTNLKPQQHKYDEAHFYAECSNKGICNRKDGLCECFSGYEGEGCERTTCPGLTEAGLTCSGHGVCQSPFEGIDEYQLWDKKKTYRCKCDPSYTGPDCSLRKCPLAADPQTHQLVYKSSTQKIEFGAFTYYGVDFTDSTQVTDIEQRLIDGNVEFTITVLDYFGDQWSSRSFSVSYQTRTTDEAVYNYPTSYDFEQLLQQETPVDYKTHSFEKGFASAKLFFSNVKSTDLLINEEVQVGLNNLPNNAVAEPAVHAVFAQPNYPYVTVPPATQLTCRATNAVFDSNSLLASGSRHTDGGGMDLTTSKCEYPAGWWDADAGTCSNGDLTSETDCVSQGYLRVYPDGNECYPMIRMNSPAKSTVKSDSYLSFPQFLDGNDQSVVSEYDCGSTATTTTTDAGTKVHRRGGLCLYIVSRNKVQQDYEVTYAYKSQHSKKLDDGSALGGTFGDVSGDYTSKNILGKSVSVGDTEIRDYLGEDSVITNTLVRVTDVSAARKPSSEWTDAATIKPVGHFGKRVTTGTTQTVYQEYTSLYEVTLCASRGLCMEATGECSCFVGFSSTSCNKQRSLSFTA